MKSELKQIFLQLVQIGMWGKAQTFSRYLSAIEWEQIYIESCKQSIQGLIYDAVCLLPKDFYPNACLWNQWSKEVLGIEKRWKHQLMTLNYLVTRFQVESKKITPIVVKGLAVAEYYQTPSHRSWGDIDLYYGSRENAFLANKTVEKWGIPIHYSQNDSVYMLNGVAIEHHSFLIESHVLKSDIKQKKIEQLFQENKGSHPLFIAGSPIEILCPELEGLLLISHSYKHLLNEGIGFRQLCDFALFLHVHGPKLQQSKIFLELLESFKMKDWADLLFCFCVQYLGLSKDKLPYPIKDKKKSKKLLFALFHSGNMGAIIRRKKLSHKSPLLCKMLTTFQICRNILIFGKYSPQETYGWIKSLLLSKV